jgi:CRISPR/Cas system-associated endoribonuclease Cas2
MFTTNVGRTFLKEYNDRNGKSYSAKTFFDKILFKLFFDHKKYLMWVQNSPFVQGINKKKPFFQPEERLENLAKLHQKIDKGDKDASIAIGYPASEIKEFATTSGLVTDIEFPFTKDEVYLSWIGSTLGLGVSGGYAILFDNPEITYATFEGWKVYRKYLNDPVLERLRPNQITTWNGQWLTYRLGRRFREAFAFNTLQMQGIFSTDEKKIEVNTIHWSELFFSLFRKRKRVGQTKK